MQEETNEVLKVVETRPEDDLVDGSVAERDPVAVANAMFGTYLPRFKIMMRNLKGKAKDRVMNAIIEVPLNDRDFNPQTKEEKEVFLIGQALLNAKRIIIESVLMEHEKAMYEAQKQAATEAKSETISEGETND